MTISRTHLLPCFTFAALVLLTGCAAAPEPAPAPVPSEVAETEPAETTSDSGDIAGACEAFNAISDRLGAADESEPNIFIDIYEEADAAAAVAPEDIRGALLALGIVALDRDGGDVPEEHSDLLLDQVLHITPICAAEGVEIVL